MEMGMQTVDYEDEGPITYLNGGDKVILEGLKGWLQLSVREVYPMLIRMFSDGVDPIIAHGDVFEFNAFGAPEPRDRVNLFDAVRAAERDARTCQMMLEGEADRAEAVLRNSKQWLAFWSERAPTEELRKKFSESLRQLGG
jgi:hypothetical protein